MNDHYAKAEEALAHAADNPRNGEYWIGRAQVHATLALTDAAIQIIRALEKK